MGRGVWRVVSDSQLGLPRLAWRIAAVFLAGLAAFVALLPRSGTPGVEIEDLGDNLTLVLHGLGFALLAFVVMVAQRTPRPVVTSVGLILYGGFLEMTQGLVGYRSAQLGDMLANASGVLIGVALALLLPRPRPA